MTDIFSLTYEQACAWLCENGFRATQAANIFRDIYKNKAGSFDEMKSVSAKVKQLLSDRFYFGVLKIDEILQSVDTVKYLFELSDGCRVETVLMRQKYGNSVCISTQSGCNMGCKFCCSGRMKKQRDLTAGEMILQILSVEKHQNITISNITVMGIGEPFDNYQALCDFIDIATLPHGLEMGTNHITVSTCGLCDRIRQFADRKDPCNLAVSLHAPNDEIRDMLMPVNRRYKVGEVIKAAKYYSEKCNRKVLLEYIMLDGINDSRENARQLAELIGEARLFVNLIPFNASQGSIYRRSGEEKIKAFYDELKKNGINVTRRKEFGSQLSAACGQLRSDRIISIDTKSGGTI